MNKYKNLKITKKWLTHQISVLGKTRPQLARELGVGRTTMFHWCVGIKRPDVASTMIGKRFNRLVIIKKAESDRGGHRRYLCLCDCGKQSVVRETKLKMGKTLSCGCYKACIARGGKRFVPAEDKLRYTILRNYKRNAKTSNREWKLPDDVAFKMFQSNCYYCNKLPSNRIFDYSKLYVYIYNGIDRKDNSQGYTPDNCIPCCAYCNYTKWTAHHDDFIFWIKTVYNNLMTKGVKFSKIPEFPSYD